MLEAHNIEVKSNARLLLQDVSLQLQPGELLAVLGPNGAGKSTLLQALAGDLKPAAGRINLNGRPLSAWSAAERARMRAVLPQFDRLNFPFRVHEVVALGLTPYGGSLGPERERALVIEALGAANALPLAARIYSQLSGGEKKRVQIARVLVQVLGREPRPTYLLLDEPTSSLDLAHQHETLRLMQALKTRNVGILSVLHDVNLAARYADRVALLRDGCLLAAGPARQVLTGPRLSSLYGIELEISQGAGDFPIAVVCDAGQPA